MGRTKGSKNNAKAPVRRQTALEAHEEFVRLLKKPMEVIGKLIDVPGEHWGSSAAARDRNKIYKCAVKDFQVAYKSSPQAIPTQAMQLTELGEDGHGGTSEDFWMLYPHPFLKFYYKTYPLQLEESSGVHGGEGVGGDDAAVAGGDAQPGQEKEGEGDSKAKQLRTMTLKYVDYVSSAKVPKPCKMAGRMKHLYKCNIEETPGRKCGSCCTVYGSSTGPIFKHIRRYGRKAGYAEHKAALLKLEESSCRRVLNADGEWVTVHSFEDAFPHHVDFLWLVASGLPTRLNRRPAFLAFVRGYDPRAILPHRETVHRIAECIGELQEEEQRSRLANMLEFIHGLPCVGLQLDLWTDRNTGLCYAAMHMTSTRETESTLSLVDELLDFAVFPYTEHTGENIKKWFLNILQVKRIPLAAIAGVTPDGAADGKKAISLIPELRGKRDTCALHQLQRAILYSIGLAGSKTQCRNREARDLIRQHNRVVRLSHQSREVAHGFRKVQKEAGINPHHIVSTVRTNSTRWGNQKLQITRNCLMRPIQDKVLAQYKREHVGETVLLEDSSASDASDDDLPRTAFHAPKKVTRRDVGLDSRAWEASLELESFLTRPYQIKEMVEHQQHLTGAQVLFLAASLRASCDAQRPLVIRTFPASAAMRHRARAAANVDANSIVPLVVKARAELIDQLNERMLTDEMPSETRLVQLYMSKQASISKVFPDDWVSQAKALYLVWLRRAASALNMGTRVSPPRAAKRSRNMFDGLDNGVGGTIDAELTGPAVNGDAVISEVKRWEALPLDEVERFRDAESGLLNEFHLHFALRSRFPLHYFVFRQTAVHIGSEANAETTFSLSGSLSNDNTHTGADFLSLLTRIKKNQKVYSPEAKVIYRKYLAKYGELEMEDEGDEEVLSSDEDNDSLNGSCDSEGEAGLSGAVAADTVNLDP